MRISVLAVEEACAALRQGNVLIYPTETFYGLGCNALNPDAVGLVYAVKRRPYGLPLPVIVGDISQVEKVVRYVHPVAQKLMDAFWPGPLSIIFPAAPEVPDLLTAGAHRIAVRLSAHPGAVALCRESGMVLTASSANVSGRPPVTTPEALDQELADGVAGLYNVPPYPRGGEPSTIVDMPPDGTGAVRLLRPGAVSLEALNAAGFEVDIPSL